MECVVVYDRFSWERPVQNRAAVQKNIFFILFFVTSSIPPSSMRFEILLLAVVVFLITNTYYDGKLMHLIQNPGNRKYYQMAAIALGGLMLYIFVKKMPGKAYEMIATSNDYLRYLPLDRQTASFVSPILDFTTRQELAQNQRQFFNPLSAMQQRSEHKITQSGRSTMGEGSGGGAHPTTTTKTKRSVSESKKKYVAWRQGWKCGQCGNQLTAWFEVDHKIRLEYGGSNHVDNLVALCRECHGHKTTIENL